MTLDFDFIRWMIGPPASVYATAVLWSGLASAAAPLWPDKGEADVPGEISAILNYDSRVTATVLASGIMPKGFPFSVGFRILFEKGAFDLKTVFEGAGPPKNVFHFYSEEGAQLVTIEEHDPYEQELRYFVDSIRGEKDPGLLDAQHAAEALKLSLATLQSAKEGRAIELPR